MSGLITGLFLAATAVAYGTQILDWVNTEKNIAKSGLSGEKNPIIKFLFEKSKYLALAYKVAPPTALVLAALHYGDLKYWGVQYVNAPAGQVDKWAIGWILGQLGIAAIGLYGYLSSKKA
jgi:hypothetical protein